MRFMLFLLLSFSVSASFAQEFPGNYTSIKVAANDTILIDKVSINPVRFKVIDNKGLIISPRNYEIDFSKSRIIFNKNLVYANDSLTISYFK